MRVGLQDDYHLARELVVDLTLYDEWNSLLRFAQVSAVDGAHDYYLYRYDHEEGAVLAALGFSPEICTLRGTRSRGVVLRVPDGLVLHPDVPALAMNLVKDTIGFEESTDDVSNAMEEQFKKFGPSWEYYHWLESVYSMIWMGREMPGDVSDILDICYVAALAFTGPEKSDETLLPS